MILRVKRSFERARHSTVFGNILSLYIVRIASMIIPLFTLPILARRLGKDEFGTILYGQYLGGFVAVVLDFGFLYTATRKVARNREDGKLLSAVVAEIQGAKIILAMLFAVISLALYFVIPQFQKSPIVISIFLLFFAFQQISPLWYFQGVEKISQYARTEFIGRIFLLISTVFVVNKINGAETYALLSLFSAIFIMLVSSFSMYRMTAVSPLRMGDSAKFIASSFPMFLMRVGASLYMAAPAIVLGQMGSTTAVAGYGGAERIFRAAAAMLSPINDAIFPRMSYLFEKNKSDYKVWLRMTMIFLFATSLAATAALYVLAPLLVKLLLGNKYESSVGLVRILSLAIPAIALGSYAGVQILLPSQKDNWFTSIVLTAGLLNLVTLYILVPRLAEVGAAYSVVMAEWIVCILSFIFASRLQSRGKET
jgi:polysaccharide transporter, PST family